MDDTPKTLSIEAIENSYQDFISRPYVSEDLRERLDKANVLLLPNEGYGDRQELVYFPGGTTEFFQYIESQDLSDIIIEVCMEEEDYKEVVLHADWLILPTFIVVDIVVPIMVKLIAEYIIRTFGERLSDAQVKSEMIVREDDSGRLIKISYEGPASDYRDAVLLGIKALERKSPNDLKDESD